MKRLFRMVIVAVMAVIVASCTGTDTTPPNIVETFPATGSVDVDPSITEITVTFDEPMTDGNWSWAYTKKSQFPQMNG